MILRTIGRLIMVPLGAILAAMASFIVLFTLGQERITHAITRGGWEIENIDAIFDILKQAQLMSSAATIVPALLLIIVGEVGRIRSSVYYLAGGGVALAAIPLMAKLGYAGATLGPTDAVWQVFATAGFAGGFVYWLVAGRRA